MNIKKIYLLLIIAFTFFGGNVFAQGSEDFTNIPTSSPGSYLTRSWTGYNGETWSATDARTDQTITSKAITIRNGGLTFGLTSSQKSAGIGNLTIKAKAPFGNPDVGKLELKVNGSSISTITTTGATTSTVVTYTWSNVNVSSLTSIVINQTEAGKRIAIDDVSWTAYPSGPTSPTVSTTSISSITTTAASGGGNVTADGGATVTERGIVYKTSTNPTTSDSKVTDGGTGTGSYTSSLTSLATNTKYYVRAYAINSEGTAYGSNEIFTTLSNAPAMDNATARNPSYASFTANWTAPTNDGAEAYTYTLEVSTNAGDFSSPVVTQANISATNYNVTGLNASTNYYYRVKAVNAGGSSAFSSVSTVVTTLTAVAPTVTTTSLSSITTTSASGGGNVTADGGATVTERGIVYSTSANPTTADTKIIDGGTGTGSYTSSLTSLTANTTYHVRAYAINSVNTSYGSDESFVTQANEPTTISTVSFGTVTNNSLVVNFTGGDGAKRIVLMRKSSAVNIGSAPVDDTTYTASATFGSGDVIPTEANVVYVGSGTTVTVTNLDKNATYHVAVYEFNENSEGAPNYLTTDRATGNKTTYNPNISVSSITAFGNQVINTISASKSYPVIGSQLASNITVTAPAGFQISTDDVDFSVNPITLVKNGNDSVTATIYVRYVPTTATGSTGAVNITNTATDATTRNVGISGNAIDEEPTVESSISFGNISSGSMVLNFAGGDAYKRLVLVKEGSAVNAAPTDGTNYTANTAFKSGSQIGTGNYVVFNGTANTVTVTNLKANTTYHVAVFGFNEGTGTSQNYLAAVTGINNATTKAVIAGWDFTGKNNVATSQATTFDTNIETASNADYITRGSGAAASAGNNSFRTSGFQNDGIATTNTDYFQITLQA
ncbi:MAG: fibronectin type III domain-containing protein, partial [Chitinophagales bacterium]|nr:fibronectin type III domain-containing protein [Chitinophagales bacterium]